VQHDTEHDKLQHNEIGNKNRTSTTDLPELFSSKEVDKEKI
jgi:hypothetical protein